MAERSLLRRAVKTGWKIGRSRIQKIKLPAGRDIGRHLFPIRKIIGSLQNVLPGQLQEGFQIKRRALQRFQQLRNLVSGKRRHAAFA